MDYYDIIHVANYLAQLKKREDISHITTEFTDIKRMIRKYY